MAEVVGYGITYGSALFCFALLFLAIPWLFRDAKRDVDGLRARGWHLRSERACR
jgi:hypothetical protein